MHILSCKLSGLCLQVSKNFSAKVQKRVQYTLERQAKKDKVRKVDKNPEAGLPGPHTCWRTVMQVRFICRNQEALLFGTYPYIISASFQFFK